MHLTILWCLLPLAATVLSEASIPPAPLTDVASNVPRDASLNADYPDYDRDRVSKRVVGDIEARGLILPRVRPFANGNLYQTCFRTTAAIANTVTIAGTSFVYGGLNSLASAPQAVNDLFDSISDFFTQHTVQSTIADVAQTAAGNVFWQIAIIDTETYAIDQVDLRNMLEDALTSMVQSGAGRVAFDAFKSGTDQLIFRIVLQKART